MYETIFRLQAQTLKALAHSRRLEIVHLLRNQTLPVTDIYSMLDLPQANISQHLMVLRQAGVVTTHKQGKQVFYRLTNPRFLEVCDAIRSIVSELHAHEAWASELQRDQDTMQPVHHDLVCGMRVTAQTAGASCEHEQTTFYFCASGCRQKFEADPQLYLKKTHAKTN